MPSFSSLNETVPHHVNPNYYYQSKQPALLAWCVFVIIFSIIAVALRFYARRVSKQRLWWDDWLALATVPFAVAQASLTILQMSYGLGRHAVVLRNSNPDYPHKSAKIVFVALFLYQAGLAFFKLSLLALYWRLFSVSTWVRYYITTVSVLIVLWTVTMEFLNAFRCVPVSANWTSPVTAKCVLSLTNQRSYFYVQTIPTIILDVVIVCIPIIIVWTFRLSSSNRIGVTLLFLATCTVTVISIVRLHLSLNSSQADTTYSRVCVRAWSLAELVAGLFSACLLSYAPILRQLIAKVKQLWTHHRPSQRVHNEDESSPDSLRVPAVQPLENCLRHDSSNSHSKEDETWKQAEQEDGIPTTNL